MKAARTLVVALTLFGCGNSQRSQTTTADTQADIVIVPVSDATWDQLNPARGDQSPKAATLWGDRNGRGPTGFLFHPVDGFSSPPHIHNVSYRGIVIHGLVHNNHPDAPEDWMPAGSFWTQTKGAVHITSARGHNTLAYIEIDDGPYLVRPVDQAFSTGEKSVNLASSQIDWEKLASSGPEARVAHLWGNPDDGKPNGTLLKLQPGYRGIVHSQGHDLRIVVVDGVVKLHSVGRSGLGPLEPGSYVSFGTSGPHQLSCHSEVKCSIYCAHFRSISSNAAT